jgi:hypothetical protein
MVATAEALSATSVEPVAGGEHEDGNAALGAQTAGDFETVEPLTVAARRQHDVQHDDVGWLRVRGRQRGPAVAGDHDPINWRGPGALQERRQAGVVLHHQHS